MNKSCKTILEAGITPNEFDDMFAGDISIDDYLSEYPLQAHRYKHLADLALGRGLDELYAYFLKKSGLPKIVDWCG